MNQCLLRDRGILGISGDDAGNFLNRLLTNNVPEMGSTAACFAGLLSPQGKLLFDVFVVSTREGYLLDCQREQATDLAKKLTMFKLRAKVAVTDRSEDLGVAAVWNSVLMEAPGPAFRDPRHNRLGYRIIAPPDWLGMFDDAAGRLAYESLRIACGIPKGGVDFVYGDTFVHDVNMDLLHGVDFQKGCYVGQEVVSRVQHRNSARKRVVRLHFHGEAPEIGATVQAGEAILGTVSSVLDKEGLATVRTDRLADAAALNIPVTVGGTLVEIGLPAASVIEPPAYADDLYD